MEQRRKVLLLGSGGLKIGQAGEFDYSGSQALKALQEEGIETVLINPNIATIQTSQQLADRVYFLPVTPPFVEKVIERERPDGILLSFGGQTALNCGIALFEQGVLERYNVAILGTPIRAIILTEDRQQFAQHLHEVAIPTPQSRSATSLQEALTVGEEIGFPVMVRAGFALGGQGSGIASDAQELERIVTGALAFAPQVLIEQYLHHYKEVEYEVVRDAYDNCITVCNMENMDPLGIHTGESVVVAPSQTLTNAEYHLLRSAAITIVKSLGIVGECNVQFALDPRSRDYYVIEVNARLSRSSALASKATGYPLAYVAAKLALGYALPDLPNKVTGVTTACFEPSLDYLVVKMPRWDLQKFQGVDETIGTSMKSVGEVMGIGRTFEEAYQKAIRMLGLHAEGAVDDAFAPSRQQLDRHLRAPTSKRLFALGRALQEGGSVEALADITGIDPWFLQRIKHIVDEEQALRADPVLTPARLGRLKQIGCSDRRIAELTRAGELEIRALRQRWHIVPAVLQIDTLAAEYPSETNYLYLTYNAGHHDVAPLGTSSVALLGSGPYHIGSSVEFDWTCVRVVEALKQYDKNAIVINCNPETVSTDHDVSSRLYFEELSFERIADIYNFEQPEGIIVSVGGQMPNNRAKALQNYGCRLLGTDATSIDRAEDRSKFSRLLDQLAIPQPPWRVLSTLEDVTAFAASVGYPVLVRPSYVLSGSAMRRCANEEELLRYVKQAQSISPEHPVTVSKFYTRAREIELDAVAQHGEVKAFIVSEHIENAGVHSGDATIVLPPQTVTMEQQREMERVGRLVAGALNITGPFNIQFLVKDDQVLVIEANVRASRTFPFIAKVTGIDLIALSIDALYSKHVPAYSPPHILFTAVKAPQFSFARLTGADPVLGVEMASTGEVACFGEDIYEAYLKAILATGGTVPRRGIFLAIEGDEKRAAALASTQELTCLGLPLYAPADTWEWLRDHGIAATSLDPANAGVTTTFREHLVDLAIIVTSGQEQEAVTPYYHMRRLAVDTNTPLVTKVKQLRVFARALTTKDVNDLPTKAWHEYVPEQRGEAASFVESEAVTEASYALKARKR